MFDDATDIIRVKPGGCFIWIAPKTGATVSAAPRSTRPGAILD
jgi:hypothetical protein